MNLQWTKPASEHRTRRRLAAVTLATALLGALGCGGESTTTTTTPTEAQQLTPAAAYDMAIEETKDDPALKEFFSRDAFQTLARTMCEQLDEGGSPDSLLATMSEASTQSGRQLRPESARAIASAGVRAYCPHHASKLQ